MEGTTINEGDENYRKIMEQKMKHPFIAIEESLKDEFIKKACEWLSNVSIEDMQHKYDNFDTSEGWYKFIEDFKKAMEDRK